MYSFFSFFTLFTPFSLFLLLFYSIYSFLLLLLLFTLFTLFTPFLLFLLLFTPFYPFYSFFYSFYSFFTLFTPFYSFNKSNVEHQGVSNRTRRVCLGPQHLALIPINFHHIHILPISQGTEGGLSWIGCLGFVPLHSALLHPLFLAEVVDLPSNLELGQMELEGALSH